MEIKSLGLQTDLIYPRHLGKVIDRGTYIAVKTPSRPNYFWGNYPIMPKAPKVGDLAKWRALYDSEFDSTRQGFMTFAVDSAIEDSKEIMEFTAAGFRTKSNVVLTATKVSPPPKLNSDVIVRQISSEEDWLQVPDVHFSDDWYLNPESQRAFLDQKVNDLRDLGLAGLGRRFGAFLEDKLVAELGIYTSGGLGRFNDVATHRDFRRQGLCGTLVYKAASAALNEMNITTLVMEADEDYHAARIYESLGFRPSYWQTSLEWFNPAVHG